MNINFATIIAIIQCRMQAFPTNWSRTVPIVSVIPQWLAQNTFRRRGYLVANSVSDNLKGKKVNARRLVLPLVIIRDYNLLKNSYALNQLRY